METALVEVCRPAENCTIDVIFIHGIDGDPMKTWMTDNSDSFWPRWLGEDLPSAAICSIGYNAWSSKWRGPSMRLPERAINLLTYLDASGFGKRPLCFVCHSLGGLIAKQILFHSALALDHRYAVADATRGIVFLGTPHTGAGLANIANALRSIYRPNKAIRDLESNDAYLKQLNDWYRSHIPKAGIRHLVMYETQKLNGILVVDSSSADPGIPSVVAVPVDANHLTLSKPATRRDIVYIKILGFVKELASSVPISNAGIDLTGEAPHSQVGHITHHLRDASLSESEKAGQPENGERGSSPPQAGIGDLGEPDTTSDTITVSRNVHHGLLYYCYISEGKVNQILSQSLPPSQKSIENAHETVQTTKRSLQEVVSDYFGDRPEYGRPDSLRFDVLHQNTLVVKLHEALLVIQNEVGEVPWLQQEILIGHLVRRGAYLYEGEFMVTNYDNRFAYLSSPLPNQMTLRLSCSLRYFSDMWRNDEFIPHSGNAMFFSGEVQPFFQTLFYVLQVRDKTVLGTPVYLGQELTSQLQL